MTTCMQNFIDIDVYWDFYDSMTTIWTSIYMNDEKSVLCEILGLHGGGYVGRFILGPDTKQYGRCMDVNIYQTSKNHISEHTSL
jgi:hypothetical protein